MDTSTTMTFVAILVVLVVNAIALPLIKTLVGSERRMSVSTEKAALIGKMFAVQFMNTALITLVVNMAYNTEKNNPDLSFLVDTLRVVSSRNKGCNNFTMMTIPAPIVLLFVQCD